MTQEYYQYNKEQLLANPRLSLICMTDDSQASETMVKQMVEEIRDHNAKGGKTVFICPVGPMGQYPYFMDMVNGRSIGLKDVWFISTDEYLDDDRHWVSMEHPLGFRGFIERTAYSKTKPELVMPKEQRMFPSPGSITYIPELVERLGDVDIAFDGIGINGYVAFNEANSLLSNQELLAQKTRILHIIPGTRTANAIGDSNDALEDVPKYCATTGTYEIAHARRIRLSCFHDWYRAVVRRAAYGESTVEFSMTLLHNRPDITLTFTDYVAALAD